MHMSKRGSPYLRHALWQAASMAIRFDPELRAYYDRKRKEGKHHTDPVRSAQWREHCTLYWAGLPSAPYAGNCWLASTSYSRSNDPISFTKSARFGLDF